MKNYRYSYGKSKDQFGDLRLPDGLGPFPLVIVIHGGFWRDGLGLDLMDPVAEALTQHGYATWNIEYRRVGDKEGGWPNTLLDVGDAADYARVLQEKHPIDLKKTAVIGHSAGGHLALWIAARQSLSPGETLFKDNPLRTAAAISLAGVSDLATMYRVHYINESHQEIENNPTRDLLGGSPEEVPERYKEASPYERLPLNVPQTLIHGELDVHVPVGLSERYFEKASEWDDEAELVKIPSAEHFMMIEPESEVFPLILEALNKMREGEEGD